MNTHLTTQAMNYRLKLLVILYSLMALIGAFTLEHLLDIVPCELCLLQRWAHLFTLLFAVFSLFKLNPKMAGSFFVLALFSLFVGTVIAFYQYGLEMRWWNSLVSCVPFPTGDEKLFMENMNTPGVPCDIKGHTLFGLTLSAYNGLFSSLILLINLALFSSRKKSNR